MSEHTPGPWKPFRSLTCGHLRAGHNPQADPRSEWTEADIALIARAPELQAQLTAAQQRVAELDAALRDSNAATLRWMEAAGKLDGDNVALQAKVAELEREVDHLLPYRQVYERAIECVDKVFQEQGGKDPLLPDFLKIAEDKFEGVVKLAHAYNKLTADNARLQARVAELEGLLREGLAVRYRMYTLCDPFYNERDAVDLTKRVRVALGELLYE